MERSHGSVCSPCATVLSLFPDADHAPVSDPNCFGNVCRFETGLLHLPRFIVHGPIPLEDYSNSRRPLFPFTLQWKSQTTGPLFSAPPRGTSAYDTLRFSFSASKVYFFSMPLLFPAPFRPSVPFETPIPASKAFFLPPA